MLFRSAQRPASGIDLLGIEGNLWDADGPDAGRWAYQFLYDRSMTIAGGTSEVQRNIVAQRILGLPRDRGSNTATKA